MASCLIVSIDASEECSLPVFYVNVSYTSTNMSHQPPGDCVINITLNGSGNEGSRDH